MELGVTLTFPSRKCARKAAMMSSQRCAKHSARLQQSILLSMAKATTSALQANMKLAASRILSLVLPIAAPPSAFLALQRKTVKDIWKIVAQPQIVILIAWQPAS